MDFRDMENGTTSASSSSSMHPMLWIAAISVTLLSFAGIASLTGLLPGKSEPAPVAVISAAVPAYAPPTPLPAVPEAPAAVVVPESAPVALPAEAPPVTHHKTAKKKVVTHNAQIPATEGSPPLGAGVPPDYGPPPPPSTASAPPASPPCSNCGVISGIRQIAREGQGTGLGAVAGGVLGGVLGNNVGNGSGRTLATIAGAVGGGFLGNKVEKYQRESVAYQISVRMEDGTTQVIEASSTPPWRTGDQVKLVNGTIVSR
jgi:outer membrane lipoprotein SlyB